MTTATGRRAGAGQRRTGRRLRAMLVGGFSAVLGNLPARLVEWGCVAVGEAWYRAAPARAAIARGNLAHIVERLAAEGRGNERARAAAEDPAALERLVRASFGHAARTYAETFRVSTIARDIDRHFVVDDAEAVDAVFAAGGPVVFATLHLGSMAVVSLVLARRSRVPVTAPMETIDDPELQRVLLRARTIPGLRVIGLAEARRELRAALARGEGAGLVADRDISGGGVAVPLFGLPASLPIGPAYLALEAGAPLHVAVARRTGRGGFRGSLITLPHPPLDLPHRARIEALLAAEARAFEDLVAAAPEQWWTVFYPIWDEVGPRPRSTKPAPGRAR